MSEDHKNDSYVAVQLMSEGLRQTKRIVEDQALKLSELQKELNTAVSEHKLLLQSFNDALKVLDRIDSTLHRGNGTPPLLTRLHVLEQESLAQTEGIRSANEKTSKLSKQLGDVERVREEGRWKFWVAFITVVGAIAAALGKAFTST